MLILQQPCEIVYFKINRTKAEKLNDFFGHTAK